MLVSVIPDMSTNILDDARSFLLQSGPDDVTDEDYTFQEARDGNAVGHPPEWYVQHLGDFSGRAKHGPDRHQVIAYEEEEEDADDPRHHEHGIPACRPESGNHDVHAHMLFVP